VSSSGERGGKLRVLFLCTGNSCRSQMAEGWTRHLLGGHVDAFSAGTAPSGLHPLAVRVMKEAGVDISGQRSKSLDEFLGTPFDLVITLCDDARQSCPIFSGAASMVHMGFPDPAKASGTEEEVLGIYRQVRDRIRSELIPFLNELICRSRA